MVADFSDLVFFGVRRRGGGAAAFSRSNPTPNGAGRFRQQELLLAILLR